MMIAVIEMNIQKIWIKAEARLNVLINPTKTIAAASPFITK
jgi:hypothetical protein